jgi:enoyl-CoA hydratase
MPSTYTRIHYEVDEAGVATVTLARAELANAQDYQMLSELNSALDVAARDPAVRVIVVGAEGRHFSSGHDLSSVGADMQDIPLVGTATNFTAPGGEGYMDRERELYLGYSRRWRSIPKPTIARVQGRVIAGGLLIIWPMDLIVCADDATFCDPVVTLGSNGVEFFAHPYEFGTRIAKDMLFTGREMTAREAHGCGMVQRIFAKAELADQTTALARHIASQPAFSLATAKRAVNFAVDAMGFEQTLEAAFNMHHMLHNHWREQNGDLAPSGSGDALRAVLKQGTAPGLVGPEPRPRDDFGNG